MTKRRTLFWRTRERLLANEFGEKPFTLLDVGAGNDSPLRLKSVFPHCEYHGIDRDVSYNLSAESLRCADRFLTMDLTECRFESLTDDYYDAIVLSHVLEHLLNGERVLRELSKKLKPRGVMYVEWPSMRSIYLPSMRGTLNFCDDTTHVRLYSRSQLAAVLQSAGCIIEHMGICRNLWRCAAWPIIVWRNVRLRGYWEASDFWELLGFADFIWARKKSNA
jgi:ubiquinone/menaquinone biosynthesis C-methylase UbiE